jgi:hypothetical protein
MTGCTGENRLRRDGLDSTDSGHKSCENSNKPSGSIKGMEFFVPYQMNNSQFPNKDEAKHMSVLNSFQAMRLDGLESRHN